jgi:regulator of replication initiation timing
MKKIFAISIIFLICAIGKTATDSNNTIVPDSNNTTVSDTNTTVDCQEKVKQLERIIESLQKKLDKIITANNDLKKKLNEQINENERLKNLRSQAGSDTSPLKDIKQSQVNPQNLSKVSLEQLYRFYKEPITDLQKEEKYENNYKGKWVQWTGKVETVVSETREDKEQYSVMFIYSHPDKNVAQCINPPKTRVRVQFDEMLKQRLLSFKKGAIITYQGKLPDSYKNLAGLDGGQLSLTDGRIVSP